MKKSLSVLLALVLVLAAFPAALTAVAASTPESGVLAVHTNSAGAANSESVLWFTSANDAPFAVSSTAIQQIQAVEGQGGVYLNGTTAIKNVPFYKGAVKTYCIRDLGTRTAGDTLRIYGLFTDGENQFRFADTTFVYKGKNTSGNGYWAIGSVVHDDEDEGDLFGPDVSGELCVDEQSLGTHASAGDCSTGGLYFSTKNDTSAIAAGSDYKPVSGKGGAWLNGLAIPAASLSLTKRGNGIFGANGFRFWYTGHPNEVGDRMTIAGLYSDGTDELVFETTTFEYCGKSASGKGYWKVGDSITENNSYIGLSDFGIVPGSVPNKTEVAGTYGASILGKTFRFRLNLEFGAFDNSNLNANLFHVHYGAANNAKWTGYYLGIRQDGTVLVLNQSGAVGYNAAGAEISGNGGCFTAPNFATELQDNALIEMRIDPVDHDHDNKANDAMLTVKINGTVAATGCYLKDAISNANVNFGNSALFYSFDGQMTVDTVNTEIKELYLSDFGLSDGTYGNGATSVSGTASDFIYNKKFTVNVTDLSTVNDAHYAAIFYGTTNNGDWTHGYVPQIRSNGTLVVFNYNRNNSNPPYTVYSLTTAGIDLGDTFKVQYMMVLTDHDGDGCKDDAYLRVYLNGIEQTGMSYSNDGKSVDPNALYIDDALYTDHKSMLIYGEENHILKLETTAIQPTGNIKTNLQDGLLTVSGNGTVTADDLTDIDTLAVTSIRVEGPTDIAANAFDGYTALREVYFANTVQAVDDAAFVNCASGVSVRCIADKPFTGGLENTELHPYYSFKSVTIGSSYGEDMNTYLYKLAKNYYAGLPGRQAEDIAYDEIVVGELFTGGGTLAQRVNAINGNITTTCWYEKWDRNGTVINISPTGQLTAGNMRMALRDEYWDQVILMQSAADSANAASFVASTDGSGKADIDAVIDFAKQNNKSDHAKFLWLMTWSYNQKVATSDPSDYLDAIKSENAMAAGIADSMQTVVAARVSSGKLDGIIPAGAGIENLKASWLCAVDPDYVRGDISTPGATYNGGKYSNYFAVQRDLAHASCGLGRFTLGLTAFAYMANLNDAQIVALGKECYPKNLADYEIAEKLYYEHDNTANLGCYLGYDEYTESCAAQSVSAVIGAIHDPYSRNQICRSGDANGDGVLDVRDLVRYKKVLAKTANATDPVTADLDLNAILDADDVVLLKQKLMNGSF